MRMIAVVLIFLASQDTWSYTPSVALSMVPRGRLVEQVGRDFVIKTGAGTKIGIEFKRNGRFEEAKGSNLNMGDELEPGDGLISLSSAAHALAAKGIRPQGHWHLDLDDSHGWVYEFENTLVNAKTGKIINGVATHLVQRSSDTE
jgi:hypothetical protein